MQRQIYFAHWVILWSKCAFLFLKNMSNCPIWWIVKFTDYISMYVCLKKSKYLLFLCHRITSVDCWWPVVVNGGCFHEKKSRFSCHVMEIKPRKLNQCLSISWMAAALCRRLIRNCPTLCAITCHRNFSQTEDHSAREASSKKDTTLLIKCIYTRTPLTI